MNQLCFERLKGRENYDVWKIGAKAHLITKNLFSHMTTELTSSADSTTKNNDQKALAELVLLIDSSLYSHIEACETAKSGWDMITKTFENTGVVRKVSFLKQWISLKLNECESMQNYVSQCLSLRSKVKSAGFKIDEEIAASIMLCGLTDEFKPMVMSIESKSEDLTVDFVKNILLQEVMFENNDSATALAIKNKKFGHKNKNKRVIKCFECNGPHLKKDCDKFKQKKANSVVLYSSFSVHENTSEWFIDSGATAHMTNNHVLLMNKTQPRVKEVTVANNQKLSIDCVGDIDQVINDGKKITLKDVQYIPGICVNLLSVSQIVKRGFRVLFDKDGCKIFDACKKVVATGNLVNNMFKLNTISNEYACATSADQSTMLWHRRLGHASFTKMNLLLNLKEKNSIEHCEVCLRGKQSVKPFNHIGTRAENLLELVHTDVCGPINVKSMGGARFFVTFIDDFSKRVAVFLLKSKSEVFDKFVEYKNRAENELGKKIKTLRSDNGTEFINTRFEKFCISNGIKHEKSAQYTPQQNGVSERMNRTIIEKVRCMLFDSKINKNFWAEAVVAAVDIINALPNKSNCNKTPNEIWNNKKDDLSKFKVFGCKAMVLVPQQKRKKLDEKSIKCIALRYAENAKAYSLFCVKTKKIIISRDVVFVENDLACNKKNDNDRSFSQYFYTEGNQIDNDKNDNADEFNIEQRDNNTNDDSNDENSSSDTGDIVTGENSIQNVSVNLENTIVGNETINDSFVNDQSILTDDTSSESFLDDENDTLNETESNDPTFKTRARIPTEENRVKTRSMNPINNLFNFHVAFLVDEPQTYNQAMKSDEKDHWITAMKEEFNSLVKNNTWELVDRIDGQSIVDNKWIFKIKRNSDNSIERYKARLVARGFTQEYGVNYYETFSPVVRFTSIRMILAVAASKKMRLKQFDVKTAFLNGELNETIYMKQPLGFSDGSEKICKLKKSLYGLKQSSRCWNQKFKHFIQLFGFIACKSDPCVFISYKDNNFIILAIHVDDGLIAAKNVECIDAVVKHLQEHFEIKIMEIGCFLGMQIQQNSDGSIFIHQASYTRKILKKFNMENCHPVAVPMDPNQNVHNFADSERSNYPYRELIGSLMYLSVATRPDISYAIGIVSRYLEKPTIVHETAAKRILKYLAQSIEYGILYRTDGDGQLNGFSDADYAGDVDSRKSTSGFIFTYNNNIISWCSERQKAVSLSTMESEYVAASNSIRELIWLKAFIGEILSINFKKINFFMDNQSAIRLIKNPELHKRSKHIDVKYHFIREKYEDGLFTINYIPTEKMIADMLTKPLPKQRFNILRTSMSVVTNKN